MSITWEGLDIRELDVTRLEFCETVVERGTEMMSNVELLGSLILMMGSYCDFYDLCVFLQLHGEFGYLYNQRLISK